MNVRLPMLLPRAPSIVEPSPTRHPAEILRTFGFEPTQAIALTQHKGSPPMLVIDGFRPAREEIVNAHPSTFQGLPLGWMAAAPVEQYAQVVDELSL